MDLNRTGILNSVKLLDLNVLKFLVGCIYGSIIWLAANDIS